MRLVHHLEPDALRRVCRTVLHRARSRAMAASVGPRLLPETLQRDHPTSG